MLFDKMRTFQQSSKTFHAHTHKHGKQASKQATRYKSTGNGMGLCWLMSLFFFLSSISCCTKANDGA